MAKIDARVRWNGTTAFSVRWRLGTRDQRRVTLRSEQGARSLVQYLNDNGRIQERAPLAAGLGRAGMPIVAEMVHENIDLLVRPASGTVRTYQRMLDLHIPNTVGHIPVDEFGYREVMQWVKSLTGVSSGPVVTLLRDACGTNSRTVGSAHGRISASSELSYPLASRGAGAVAGRRGSD